MKNFSKPILVTKPYLPPLESFKRGCEEIWNNHWLSNDGPVQRRFHDELANYLNIPSSNLALFVNGTLALELGYQAMGLSDGEVITTPFTFVATSHALMRVGARPVFADIDPETLCLSPSAAEKLITPRTKAIVPVHVYGIACDVNGFARLGAKYGIKIIYDAAHAFGAEIEGRSIATYGEMSMFSFHPTKLFHSCEGGLLVFKDSHLQSQLFNLRNFAIRNELECEGVGSNAKMNELQALMGLECLKKIDDLLDYRRLVYNGYAEIFKETDKVLMPSYSLNKAYCPVLFKDVATREKVYEELKRCNVFTRRYFYPLLTDFAPYAYGRGTCPLAEDLASRVLALPTYYGLPLEDVVQIARNILEITK